MRSFNRSFVRALEEFVDRLHGGERTTLRWAKLYLKIHVCNLLLTL